MDCFSRPQYIHLSMWKSHFLPLWHTHTAPRQRTKPHFAWSDAGKLMQSCSGYLSHITTQLAMSGMNPASLTSSPWQQACMLQMLSTISLKHTVRRCVCFVQKSWSLPESLLYLLSVCRFRHVDIHVTCFRKAWLCCGTQAVLNTQIIACCFTPASETHRVVINLI